MIIDGQDRSDRLGASEISYLSTPYEYLNYGNDAQKLMGIKTGKIKPDDLSKNPAVQRGKYYENGCVDVFEALYHRPHEGKIIRDRVFKDPKAPYRRASTDFIIAKENEKSTLVTICEVKVTKSFSKGWLNDSRYCTPCKFHGGDASVFNRQILHDGSIPTQYFDQIHYQWECVRRGKTPLKEVKDGSSVELIEEKPFKNMKLNNKAILFQDQDGLYRAYHVEIDRDHAKWLFELAEKFWEQKESGEYDFSVFPSMTSGMRADVQTTSNGSIIEGNSLDELVSINKEIKELEARVKTLKEEQATLEREYKSSEGLGSDEDILDLIESSDGPLSVFDKEGNQILFTTRKGRSSFDTKAFKANHERLYSRYLKTSGPSLVRKIVPVKKVISSVA